MVQLRSGILVRRNNLLWLLVVQLLGRGRVVVAAEQRQNLASWGWVGASSGIDRVGGSSKARTGCDVLVGLQSLEFAVVGIGDELILWVWRFTQEFLLALAHARLARSEGLLVPDVAVQV